MNMNLRLRGYPEQIIEQMLALGIVETKTEAVRLALTFFGEEYSGFEFKDSFVKETLARMKKKPVKVKSVDELFA